MINELEEALVCIEELPEEWQRLTVKVLHEVVAKYTEFARPRGEEIEDNMSVIARAIERLYGKRVA